MCEPTTPLQQLRDLQFSVAALARLAGGPGSFERELARCAAEGIKRELEWVMAQLRAAGEGEKNFGMRETWISDRLIEEAEEKIRTARADRSIGKS